MKGTITAILLLLTFYSSFAQVNEKQKSKIAIFAPLYLDSAFNESMEYRYAKNVFPKFINPGLEFYEGAQLALDSLAKEGAAFEVFVFDTRSERESIEKILQKPEMADLDLIIANCSGSEVRTFAEFGLANKIPVINTTMPHDGGARANPYLVVLNPTLKTQIEGIYRYVQRYYSINPIVVFRKKGATEDQIKIYLDDFTKNTMAVPLKLKYVDLPEGFTAEQLKPHLDGVRRTVCIAGSLDGSFGRQLVTQLASLNEQYPSLTIGMPTWDGRDFSKTEMKGYEVIHSNPFYNSRVDKVSEQLVTLFNDHLYARPSDMVFRGYQSTYKYGKLLMKFGDDLSSNLGNKLGNIFFDLEIQPVLSKENLTLEYFENKRLYFLRWVDGEIKGVNSI